MKYNFGPLAIKNGTVTIISRSPCWDKDFETIERKGKGHPDTIADALAAKISQSYAKYTMANCNGLILHHQIDKLMVLGGKTKVTFGSGRFINPIRIIVAGRATYSFGKKKIPVNNILNKTILSHFKKNFPLVGAKNIVIDNYLTSYAGPGTIIQSKGAIANMFNPKEKSQVRGYEKLVANDTSYCVSYAPISPLESSILKIEKYLNDKKTKKIYPWLGSDIKIMAVRNYKNVSITMCVPQIAKYVSSFEEYIKNLNLIGRIIYKKFSDILRCYKIDISINTKDDYDKMNVYLTVSGASLSGDIGVVGRGNRANGLITSNRPMSMEGVNGKNPRYYSGFIYANLTKRIAARIFNSLKKPCVVEMISQNGGLLKDPWHTRTVTLANKTAVKNIIEKELADTEKITLDFVRGNIENF
jgi:S-adenosylmethionine synthetase